MNYSLLMNILRAFGKKEKEMDNIGEILFRFWNYVSAQKYDV